MDEILKRIDKVNIDNLDSSQFYESDIDITYEDIIYIWRNFLEKKYLDIGKKKEIDLNSNKYKSVFKITIFENILASLLEILFTKQLNELKENLILIYIKNQDKILILFKSFYPLLNDKQIKLPYWDFLLEADDFCDKLKILFKKKENICIMTYIIK
jgi:hypothetical protein